MWKAFKVLFTLVIVSFFYYPFAPYFLPASMNTKMVLAVIGILLCLMYFLKNKLITEFPKNIVPIFLFAGGVSLISIFAATYNNTTDTAYAGYIVSMAVWFSAAYTICWLIKKVHGRLDVQLIANYLIAVSVLQCFAALLIDTYTGIAEFVDTKVIRGTEFMHELDRLYGIGAGLDTAGLHFSLCLILIAYILRTMKSKLSRWIIFLYVASFLILVSVGSMMARTTYVGVALSAGYLIVSADYSNLTFSRSTMKVWGVVILTSIAGITALVYEYNTNDSIRESLRFAFEGFFNLFEQGEYSVASTNTLKSMYVFPDNLKTWIIGDGYFNNPYFIDANYIYQDQNIEGYYMDTDVGYCRFIFYFGVIGLVIFSIFICKCCQISIDLMPEHKWLFLFCLACGFVVWLKVATDIFFIYALFICVGNMQDPSEELDEDELEEIE